MNESEAKEIKASNGREIDFAAIRQYVESFKKTVGCADILLPDDSAFDEKFGQLSEIVLNEFDIDVLCPIAIIDCGVCNEETERHSSLDYGRKILRRHQRRRHRTHFPGGCIRRTAGVCA